MPLPLALAYFRPPGPAFWKWNDQGQVLAWTDGATIAFRPEVRAALRRLEPSGFPPFGSIVLLLAACREGFSSGGQARGILYGYSRTLRERVGTARRVEAGAHVAVGRPSSSAAIAATGGDGETECEHAEEVTAHRATVARSDHHRLSSGARS